MKIRNKYFIYNIIALFYIVLINIKHNFTKYLSLCTILILYCRYIRYFFGKIDFIKNILWKTTIFSY